MGRILIADDHDSLRRGLARALGAAGHEIDEAPNGNAAIEKLHESYFDVVVSDLKMGGSTGLDVLKTTKTLHPSTSVILMTAFGSVSTAVEAMKNGAFDYVQKPFEIEEMEVKIEKALELKRLRHELDYLRHTQQDIYDFDRIVGTSSALARVLGVVRKVAKSNTTVLVRGETGTGKELIAGAGHHNSLRAARQETLPESEFFGHEKGAFPGADKQRSRQARPLGIGDRRQLVETSAATPHDLAHQRQQPADVVARRELRHHAAVFIVERDLRVKCMREQTAVAFVQRGAGFVAGSFNS